MHKITEDLPNDRPALALARRTLHAHDSMPPPLRWSRRDANRGRDHASGRGRRGPGHPGPRPGRVGQLAQPCRDQVIQLANLRWLGASRRAPEKPMKSMVVASQLSKEGTFVAQWRIEIRAGSRHLRALSEARALHRCHRPVCSPDCREPCQELPA